MRRLVLKALVAIAAMAAMSFVAIYAVARRSLPALDGVVTVAGISAPVEIVRDADAIPHIFAATKRDALFGLGYVHAQDRLWQMEFQRRIGHGRLSEIFGAAATAAGSVSTDGRIRPRRSLGMGTSAASSARAGQRVRRRRELVHRGASRRRAAARVHAAPLRTGAVHRPRCGGVGEDDGVGSQRELHIRAPAP